MTEQGLPTSERLSELHHDGAGAGGLNGFDQAIGSRFTSRGIAADLLAEVPEIADGHRRSIRPLSRRVQGVGDLSGRRRIIGLHTFQQIWIHFPGLTCATKSTGQGEIRDTHHHGVHIAREMRVQVVGELTHTNVELQLLSIGRSSGLGGLRFRGSGVLHRGCIPRVGLAGYQQKNGEWRRQKGNPPPPTLPRARRKPSQQYAPT